MNTNKNLGTALKENQHEAFRWLGGALGVIVYLGVVAYAEVHNFTLLARTLESQFLPVALLGVVALGLTALALPILLHHGTEPGAHRLWAILFYVADFAIMSANAVLDAALNANGQLTDALRLWNSYAVPITPLLIGAGWAVLWMLDPEQRKRDLRAQLRAATRHSLAQQVADEATKTEINDDVRAAASDFTRQVVAEELGLSVPQRKLPSTVHYNAAPPAPEPALPSLNGAGHPND